MSNALDLIYHEAVTSVPFLQTWPGYFLAKKTETEIALKYFNHDSIKKAIGLEIGCGNAFQSALIADFADKLVATDLFTEDDSTHTVGMKKAKKLIEALNKKNIMLVSCSSLALPFSDNYFDFVFSSSALEHMDDKDLALKEIKRVLKPGGHSIIIVPTHMPSLYAFVHVYLYCIARILQLLFKSGSKMEGSKQQNKDRLSSILGRFSKNQPSFPMPEPHGTYRNIFHELFSQLPFNWKRKFKRNGFVIKDSFGICLFPWLLIEPFSTMIAARIYSSTKDINKKLSFFKPLKYISYLIGIVAVKKIEASVANGV